MLIRRPQHHGARSQKRFHMFTKTSRVALTTALFLLSSCSQCADESTVQTVQRSIKDTKPSDLKVQKLLPKNAALRQRPNGPLGAPAFNSKSLRPCAPKFIGDEHGPLKEAPTQIDTGITKQSALGIKGRLEVTFEEGLSVKDANLLLQKYKLRVAMHAKGSESAKLCTAAQKDIPALLLETLKAEPQIVHATRSVQK